MSVSVCEIISQSSHLRRPSCSVSIPQGGSVQVVSGRQVGWWSGDMGGRASWIGGTELSTDDGDSF